MALFNRKKDPAADETGGEAEEFSPQPEKARKWFEHAKSMADSSNYNSALVYYANGIRLDPKALSAHEAMIEVALKHYAADGKKASAKDVKGVDGSHPVEKFAAAELSWLSNYDSPSLAIKALSAAVEADQLEFAHMIAPRVLVLVSRAKKVSRSQVLLVKELSTATSNWDTAMSAGQLALQMDPTDGALDSELKSLSAQRAMTQGGYEEAAGKEGGFREFVKDMDKQRQLEQDESIAGVGGSEEEVFERAKAAYEATPESPDVLNRYAQLLRKSGTKESLNTARKIYMKGYESLGEYRFRMNAGDIAISLARENARGLEGEDREAAESGLLKLELDEHSDRVEKYPTDRALKYKLGEIAFRSNNTSLAMECFQKSKDEPRLRTRSGHNLGCCFATEGWHSEAVDEFRETLDNLDPTESGLELVIRYDLMESLIELARQEQSGEYAREALEICSGIARKDISYRDIRTRRKELDELCRELP